MTGVLVRRFRVAFLLLTGVFLPHQDSAFPRELDGDPTEIEASLEGPQATRKSSSLISKQQRRALEAHSNLPLTFIENAGQIDDRVHYYAQGPGFGSYFTSTQAVFSFLKPASACGLVGLDLEARALAKKECDTRGASMALEFVGADPNVVPVGEAQAIGHVNHLVGSEQARWRMGLVTYHEMVYRELWPGVDLVVRGQRGELKYEFVIKPGARVEDIRLAYRGVRAPAVDGTGDLLIGTPSGALRVSRPMSYQEVDGERVAVVSRYRLISEPGRHVYGFVIDPTYDPRHKMIIDSGLLYSTYVGGRPEYGAVDEAGSAYVTGITASAGFPTTAGAYDTSYNGGGDAYVIKFDPSGSGLVYSTFLGGTGEDRALALALDPAGNVHLAGLSRSADFPTTLGAYDPTFNGDVDAFVTKLNADGSAVLYSTYLGASKMDLGFSIEVDSGGSAYVGGWTTSANFPTTTGAYDRSFNGGFADAFVTKLNPSGSAIVYSTLLGGKGDDRGRRLALSSSGEAFLTGFTDSPSFPTTAGSYDRKHNGGFDGFLTKLNASGSGLVYSTFLGGSGEDRGQGIAVAPGGAAYVTGSTASANFPVKPGAYDVTFNGGSDVFVTKVDAAGSSLVYSTYVGGSSAGIDTGYDVLLDASENAYLTGWTSSADFPTLPGGYDLTFNGGSDAFVIKLDAGGSALLFSTFLGGSGNDLGKHIAVEPLGNIFVIGETNSSDFPTTPGAFDVTLNVDPDAFVTKLAICAE